MKIRRAVRSANRRIVALTAAAAAVGLPVTAGLASAADASAAHAGAGPPSSAAPSQASS